MGLRFVSLDEHVRRLMMDEVDLDASEGTIYISPRLTGTGVDQFEQALRRAVARGNDVSLARELRSKRLLKTQETRNTKRGPILASVPVTAADTLAEGEFNRFYIRGVCRRATELGQGTVEAYRAKAVERPRSESELVLGARFNAQELLQDLRANIGANPASKMPGGPNSGISVKLSPN